MPAYIIPFNAHDTPIWGRDHGQAVILTRRPQASDAWQRLTNIAMTWPEVQRWELQNQSGSVIEVFENPYHEEFNNA